MSDRKPTYEELERRCREAEAMLHALRSGEADTLLGEHGALVLRLTDAEQHAAHVKQVLLTIRNVNQLIVEEDDPIRLIQSACETLTASMGYFNAWIALLDPKGCVTATASAGFDGGFQILGKRLEEARFTKCMTRTINSDEIVVTENPKEDCQDCPLAAEYGGRAGLSRRLFFDGATYGILSVSVPAAYAREPEEQDLFGEVASDLSFALHKIESAQRLRETESRYLEIFGGSRDGFVMVDSAGRIFDANEAYCEMLGYTLDELRGMQSFHAITPERWHEWEASEIWEKRLLGEGFSGTYEKEYIRKDGTVFPVELRCYAVREPDGRIDYLWGIARDITERKQAERRLRDERQRLEFVIDGSRLGTWEWNVQTGETVFGETWAAMVGYSLDELSPTTLDTWTALTHPEDLGKANALLTRCLAGELPHYECELRMKHKDGHWIWMLDRGRVMTRDAEGQPLMMFGTHSDITERKRAEEALRESEAQFRTLFMESPVSIILHDKDTGEIIDANPRAIASYGLSTLEELKANEFWQDPPYSFEQALAHIHKAAQEGPHDFEWRNSTSAGDLFWEHVYLRPITINGTERVLAKSIDITARKKAQQELTADKRYLERILETAADGFWVIDSTGHAVEVNEAYCAMSGYSREELLGMSIGDLDAVESPEQTAARIERIMAHGSETFETRHRRKDGSLWPVEVTASFLEDRGGVFVCFCRDLTERHAREAESRFLSAVTANMSDSIVVTDECFAITYMNKAAEELFGYSLEELRGKRPDVLHADDDTADEAQSELYEAVSAGESWLGNIPNRRKDGSVFICECKIMPLTDAGGETYAYVGLQRDVTERKRAEDALRQSEQKWRNILVDTPQIGISLDPQANIVVANAHFLELTGWREEEVAGGNWFDLFIPPEVREEVRGVFRTVMTSQETAGFSSFENKILTKEGERRTVAWSNVLSKDADGNVVDVTCLGIDLTERKEAERALRLSEERYRIVADFTYDWETWLSPDGSILYCSPAVERITGYSREEIETDPSLIAAVIHPGDREKVCEHLRTEMLDESTLFQIDYRIITKDGRERWVSHYCVPVYDEDGQFLGRRGSTRDITQRIESQEALRESERKFRDVVSSVPGAVYQFVRRADGSIEIPFMSEGARQLFGESPEELQDTSHLFSGVHPDDVPRLWESIEESAGSLEAWSFDFRIRHGETGFKWLRGASQPKLMPDGAISWYGMLWDVSEQKQAQEALRESEQQMDLILNSTAEMVAYYDTDLRIIWANRASAESVGRPTEELVGCCCYEVWHGSSLPCEGCPVLKALTTKEPQQAEMQTPDGRHWLLRGYPILDDEGEVINLVEFGQDITVQKHAAQDRARMQEQFRQAQKMESIGRLAGGVAHDFNNMLGVIIGQSEVALEETETSHPAHVSLTEIQKAAQRSADLTRQLLAFARRQTVSPKVLDINETIGAMLRMLQRLIGEDIALRWRPAPDLWQVRIDPSQVDQILANLCVNARDAIDGVGEVLIETGNVTLDEAFCTEDAGVLPGHYVLIRVGDTGAGMDTETMANVFEPFFTTKGVGEGTGLGLATVYGIVRQNQGHITVDSAEGRGTRFEIYLPRHSGYAGDADTHEEGAPDVKGHETILLVEDEAPLLALGRDMLTRLGYHVLAAASPSEATALAEAYSGRIHLLITDVIMPEMSGRDLARYLLDVHPEMKRLFMSGYPANLIADHGVLAHGTNFLPKPFLKKELAAKVREVLDA